MPTINVARRLASRIINTDIEAIHGLTTIQGYIPTRPEASSHAVQDFYEDMQAKRREETVLEVNLKAAIDDSREAEWKFHNAVLAMKESVKGQFGADSAAAQAVGYTRKSAHKRTRSRTAKPSPEAETTLPTS
jgi:hypothetical protein